MNVALRAFRRWRRDQVGTSVVELALVMPFLFVTLAGVIDCAHLISTKLKLQQAAERTAELATAGMMNKMLPASDQVASTAFASLQTEAATAANVPTSSVTVTYWLECDGTRQSDFNAICSSGQQVARFTSISIAKTYVPSFPWLFRSTGIALAGSASVRIQ